MNIDWSKLSQEQLDIAEKVVLEAQKQGVDENLALSMANIESGFKASAKSPKGAIGVMQLMPGTAKDLNVDPNNVDDNIKGGVAYIKQNFDKYKDPYLTGIAYNAGPGVADRFLSSKDPSMLPSETIDYVTRLGDLYTPTVNVTPTEATPQTEELSLEAPTGTVQSAVENPQNYYEFNPQNIGLGSAIGAGLSLIPAIGGPYRVGKVGLELGKRALGGAASGATSSLAGEYYKAGRPENFENDVTAMGIELAAGAAPTITRELIGRLPTAITNLFPGDVLTKYIGRPLKSLLGGETESEFILKETKLGRTDAAFAKRVKPGTSTDVFTRGNEEAQRRFLAQNNIPFTQAENADNAVRNFVKTNIDDLFKQGKAFSDSPQYQKLQADLAQSIRDGLVDPQELKIITKVIGSQKSPLNADKFKTTLLNLAQQSETTGYKVYNLDKTAQKLLTSAMDDYFTSTTGKPLYGILKKVEEDKYVAQARDSLPVLIQKGFKGDDIDQALTNLSKSKAGVEDFRKSLSTYLKVIPEKDLVNEFNRLEPVMRKSKVLPMEDLTKIKRSIAEYKSTGTKLGTVGAVVLKDSILGLLGAEAARVMPM
jgi:hypothetical protein